MENFGFALDGAWRVLAAGLVMGAGLPALFALGIRALAFGKGGSAEVSHAPGRPVGVVLAWVCFAIVLGAIALGISVIVAAGMGMVVSFEHIIPTFVPKG